MFDVTASCLEDDEPESASIALVYIGSVVPDEPIYNNSAFSRSGNLAQGNLLRILKDSRLLSLLVLSQKPLRAFPNAMTLFNRGKTVLLSHDLYVRLVPFLNLPFLRPLTVGLFVVFELLRWGWRNRNLPRVVYTFNLTEPPGLFVLIGARLINAKVVGWINDINIPGETVPATLARRLDFWLQKRLIPLFDGLVVLSKKVIEDFAPQSTYIQVEGGVDETLFQKHFLKFTNKDLSERNFTIVSVGSLTKANGIEEILEAFSLLKGEDFELRIAGKGPLEDRLMRAIKHDSRIKYLGFLSIDEVWDLYRDADVLINMRLTRTIKTEYFFPSKLLEYIASGVPVITTCVGNVEEEYGDKVLLLQEETPENLADLIEYVASLPREIRLQKGKIARDYIRKYKTWKVQGYCIANFINDLSIRKD